MATKVKGKVRSNKQPDIRLDSVRDVAEVATRALTALKQRVAEVMESLPEAGKGKLPQALFELDAVLKPVMQQLPSGAGGYIAEHVLKGGRVQKGRYVARIKESSRVAPQWKTFAVEWGTRLFKEDAKAVEKRARDKTKPSVSRSVEVIDTEAQADDE